MEEKRRHERVQFRVPVTCTPQGGVAIEGVIGDLSMGGMFVEAASAPPYGTEVTLRTTLPGSRELSFPAIVRWRKPGGFGVQFGLLGAVETHALATVVSRARLGSRR